MDCIVCRDFHESDGEPCPADFEVTVVRIETGFRRTVGLCDGCAGGIDLTAFALQPPGKWEA